MDPTGGGRRLSDYQPPPDDVNKDEYQQSRQQLHTDKRTPNSNANPRDQEPSSMFSFAGLEETQSPSRISLTPRMPNLEYYNGNTSTSLLDHNDSSQTHRVAKRPASPSIAGQDTNKRQQTHSNSTQVTTSSTPSRKETSGDFHMEMEVELDSFDEEAVVQDWENIHGHQEGRGPQSKLSLQKQIPELGPAFVEQMVPHTVSRSANGGSQNGQRHMSPREPPSYPQLHFPVGGTSSQQANALSPQPIVSQQYYSPQNHSSPDRPPRITQDLYSRSNSQSRAVRSRSVHPEFKKLSNDNMANEDSVRVDRDRQTNRETDFGQQSVRQASTSSRMRQQSLAPEDSVDRSRSINRTNGSDMKNPVYPFSDPRMARSNVTAHDLAFQHYSESLQTSAHRQQTPDSRRGTKQFMIDDLSGDDSDTEIVEERPQSSNNRQRSISRQPTVEPQRSFRRASTVDLEQLDYGNYHSLVRTPQVQKLQHRAEEDIPHQRPLGSPIWGLTPANQLPRNPACQLISSNHPLQGYTPVNRYCASPAVNQSSSILDRGREAALRTPSMQPIRSQSRPASVRRSPRTPSQPPVNRYFEAPQSRPRAPHTSHNEATSYKFNVSDLTMASESKQSIRSVRTPKTPKKQSIKHGDVIDDGLLLQDTPMEDLFKQDRNKNLNSQRPPDRNTGIQRIHVPEGGIFRTTKVDCSRSQTVKPETPEPLPRLTSGRGLKAPVEQEVIDLLTPETSMPMKERLTPAAKKAAPKKAASTLRAKTSKEAPAPSKRAAKPKEEKIAPEILRQQRAAEVIVSKELKGAEDALDKDLFGEVVHDQAAEDRKAEEARIAGQRKRDEVLAELLVKEKAARVAEAEKKKKLAEEAEKRKLEKEQEEEQKKIKRDAERKKALALEKHEQGLLRKKAEEQIRANREKAAEEERQKGLEKQKAAKAQAEASAKLKAKQDEAKKQAASLSAAKVSSADVSKSADVDVLMEDASSLFMPEIPATATSTTTPTTSSSTSTVPSASDTPAEPPKPQETAPGSIAQVFAQAPLPSFYRAEKDAEEVKLAAEQSRAARKKLEARWAAKAHSSKTEDRQSAPPAAARPKPAPRPELAAGKSKPAKFPPVPKKDLPPPNPKTKSEPKPKASRAKVNNSFGSESSSSSGTPHEASSFLENLAAKSFFNGLPKTFSSFGRTEKKPAGPKSREYKHKVQLISELEREEIEKAEKEKKAATRKPRDRRKIEEQKAEAAKKRSVAAKEKKTQQIREEAEKNGTEISEEELNKQVKEFMEKREKELDKRRIGYLRKEQGNASPLHDSTDSSQPFQPFEAQVEAADDEDLSPEEKLRRKTDRDYKATIAAICAQRNNGFDQASRRKTVADFTDSEESEEDPDDEIIVPIQKPQIADADDKDDSSDEDEDGVSESEPDSDDEGTMSPQPETSASLKSLSEAANVSARHSFNSSINEALNAASSHPPSGTPSRLVMLYQVMKKELIKSTAPDEENATNTQMVEQFLSLADANAFAKDIMNKFREYAHVSLSEWYKDGKYKGCIAHGETHESTIYIVTLTKASSDFPSAALREMPKKFLEKSYVVMQYSDRRTKNAETGEFETHHREPKRLGFFSILQMANHDACKQLIEITKPPGARIDDLEMHTQVAKQARENRDKCNADDREFDAEMECPPWMKGYSSLNFKVEKWEIEGPVN